MLLPLRQIGLRRIPLVRYSARTKRENRIQVQLLKDFPQYGLKGEIIEVLPGLMRNKLYPNNGACYIIPRLNLGPRIPVVKKQVKAQVIEEVKEEIKPKIEIKSKKIQSIEIDSLLFDIPEANEESSYSLFNLEVKIELLQLSKGSKTEITKDDIIDYINQSINVKVPISDLTLLKGETAIDSIQEVGEYKAKIRKDGSTVTKTVIVSP